jgi:DNA-binding CsgD family transcriptional regulator
MAGRDLVGIIEAAYETEGTDRLWLRKIVDTASPLLERGLGVTGYLVDMRKTGPRPHSPVTIGGPRGWRAIWEAMNVPGHWDREIEEVYRNQLPVETMSTALGGRAFAMLQNVVVGLGHPLGMHDWLAVKAIDPAGFGCVVSAPLPKIAKASPLFRRRWERVAAHLVAGLRLRRGLRGSADLDGDAILDTRFRVQHAKGEAESREARDMLRAAAVAIDRARGRLRQRDPDGAVELWRGLVDGRWSLVDHFDRDGRRFLVARENAPAGRAHVALSARELAIVSLAALGRSNKLIAYELGIADSAVSMALARAAKKLGVSSRSELLATYMMMTP